MLMLRAVPKLAEKFSKELRIPLHLPGINLQSTSSHDGIWQGSYDVPTRMHMQTPIT